MDKIDTLGDFRKFLSNHGGSFGLGKVRFDYEGEDIDVYLDDNLVQWVSKSEDDTKYLPQVEFTLSNDVERYKENESLETKARIENRKLKEQIGELSVKLDDQNKAGGKLEVYEKIFKGRKLTIENF